MLFRRWRSRWVAFVIIGCLALLIGISFERMRVLAQPTPTPSKDPARVTAQAPDLGRHSRLS
jgi:hypothetical protein